MLSSQVHFAGLLIVEQEEGGENLTRYYDLWFLTRIQRHIYKCMVYISVFNLQQQLHYIIQQLLRYLRTNKQLSLAFKWISW